MIWTRTGLHGKTSSTELTRTSKSLRTELITWTKCEVVRKNCYKYGRKENDGMTDVTGYGSVECMIMGNVMVEMKKISRRNMRRKFKLGFQLTVRTQRLYVVFTYLSE